MYVYTFSQNFGVYYSFVKIFIFYPTCDKKLRTSYIVGCRVFAI